MSENMQLEKLLKQYSLIETKQKNGNEWVITVLLNSYGNFIEVKQSEEYLTSVLMIGDRLLCKYVHEDYIHMLDIEVYNIKFASRSIVFRAIDLKTLSNTRECKRYDVYISSSYCIDGAIGENYAVVVNISHSGLNIITRSSLNLGDMANLSMYFSGFNFLVLKCTIKWAERVNENNLYGLEIIDLNEIARYQYDSFIKKLERKERLLIKKGQKLLLQRKYE